MTFTAVVQTKRCPRCQTTKSLGDFYRRRASRDGLATWCKACTAENVKRWLKENPDRQRAARRAWAKANPDKERQRYLRYRLKKLYGLTIERYEEILAAQGGGCAICAAPPAPWVLCVDHDHASGEIRGLLCTNCNLAVGNLRDDPTLARRAALYLERHQP